MMSLAAILLSQCAVTINDGPQVLCGQKIFTSGAYLGTGAPLWMSSSSYIHGEGPVYVSDGVAGASVTPSFYLQSYYSRTAGPLLRIDNANTPRMLLGAEGDLRIYSDLPIRVSGHSGTPSLAAYEGGYLTLLGSLPPKYWGHHGAVTIGNESVMTAGYLFQLAGATFDGQNDGRIYKAQWNYLGGWETQADVRSFDLPICDGLDVNPPSYPSNRYGPTPPAGCAPGPTGGPDGGVCHDWYVATDAGHAMPGSLMPWVVDVRAACQCDPEHFDGGRTSSWTRVSGRGRIGEECRP